MCSTWHTPWHIHKYLQTHNSSSPWHVLEASALTNVGRCSRPGVQKVWDLVRTVTLIDLLKTVTQPGSKEGHMKMAAQPNLETLCKSNIPRTMCSIQHRIITINQIMSQIFTERLSEVENSGRDLYVLHSFYLPELYTVTRCKSNTYK
jgi:hypothetical protein